MRVFTHCVCVVSLILKFRSNVKIVLSLLVPWLREVAGTLSGKVDFVWSAELFQNHSLGRDAYLRVYSNCICLRIHCAGAGPALLLGRDGGSDVLFGFVIDCMGVKACQDERRSQQSESLL